jgi:ATP-dependent DNA helicase RecG
MMTTIQCARISGKTSIKDQIVLRGDLLGQTHIVLEFIKKHMGKSAVISGRLQREERWDYPLDASVRI